MEHGFLDRYSSLDSPVHRVDPRAKVLLLMVFVLAVVSTPAQYLLCFLVYAGLLAWGIALAQVPLGFVVSRAALVLPFSAFVALGVPFFKGGETTSILGMKLSIDGLWILAGTTMKAFLGTTAAVLLVSTTSFSSLLEGLRRLGVPVLFTDLLSLTYRYAFLLVDEAMRLKRAAAVRGYRPRWFPQAVVIGRMGGNLFVRSYERAERTYGAMLLRGYNGRLPSSRTLRFRLTDALALSVIILLIAIVRVFIR